MGTLFEQKPRKGFNVSEQEIGDFLKEITALAKKNNISVADVIEAYKTLEYRRKNNLFHDNGDIFDEQMAGFGKLLEEYLVSNN